MPLTDQYDLLLNAWQAHHINKGFWNLYEHLSQVPNFAVPGHPPAPYPFGFYLFYAGWLEVLQRTGLIDYTTWRSPLVVRESPAAVLALKLPYLAAHLAIGAMLFKAAPLGWRWAALAIWAWSLSPAYLLFMGQNDLPLVLLMVAATVLGARAVQQQQTGNPRWRLAAFASMVLLGIGATYKTAPLMLVPPFALLFATRWRERAALVVLPVAIFALGALPFLDTPAFVNGALFNPEGTRLFAGVQLFAQPVSLFIVAYAGLLVLLAVRSPERRQPLDVWLVGVGVFSALFLFAWTQFYWQVWLTPFLVGLVAKDAPRRALWLGIWLISELVFGVLLFGMNRDLGWGLLSVGSAQFHFVSLDFVLPLFAPALVQPIELFQQAGRSLQIVSLLTSWGGAMTALLSANSIYVGLYTEMRQKRARLIAAIAVPAVGCLGTALAVLLLSRHATAHGFERRPNANITLSTTQPELTQVFSPTVLTGNMLLVWVPPQQTAVTLEACLLLEASAKLCARGEHLQQAGFSGYVFRFPTSPQQAQMLHQLKVRLADTVTSASQLTLPVVPLRARQGEQHVVIHGDAVTPGIIRFTLLRTFSLGEAIRDMSEWFVRDWRTIALWVLAAASAIGSVRYIVNKLHMRR